MAEKFQIGKGFVIRMKKNIEDKLSALREGVKFMFSSAMTACMNMNRIRAIDRVAR